MCQQCSPEQKYIDSESEFLTYHGDEQGCHCPALRKANNSIVLVLRQLVGPPFHLAKLEAITSQHTRQLLNVNVQYHPIGHTLSCHVPNSYQESTMGERKNRLRYASEGLRHSGDWRCRTNCLSKRECWSQQWLLFGHIHE